MEEAAGGERCTAFHIAVHIVASEYCSDVVLDALLRCSRDSQRGLGPRDKDELLDRAIKASKGPAQLSALVRWALPRQARRNAFVDIAQDIKDGQRRAAPEQRGEHVDGRKALMRNARQACLPLPEISIFPECLLQ